jgi:hypothetical protein
MKNSYPEKPEVKYQKTTVEMGLVVAYLQSLQVPSEVKRAAYVMFRNESGNGSKGLNNNYAGVQADSGRWPSKWDESIVGTFAKAENGSGIVRLFVAFRSWQDNINFLVDRVEDRGIYVGGFERLITKKNVTDQIDLKTAYKRGYIVWPIKEDVPYKPTMNEEQNALKAVCLGLAYMRSWAKGLGGYFPLTEIEVTALLNFTSMYRQATKIFI